VFKLLYKPFGVIAGIVAGLIGRKAFDSAWAKLDKEEPPTATTQYAPWTKIVGAAAMQGVIFQITRVVVDRYAAIYWHYLTGSWPGKKGPKPAERDD
jgi:hypothetical protein